MSNYEKLDSIAKGPECEVFRGRNRDLKVTVALKELPDLARRNVQRSERYYAEAAVAARLRHDSLAAILDVDRTHGWIISELYKGSLAPYLTAAASPPSEVERILRHALLGLDHIHQEGFLHANVKPTNLLLDAMRRVKLADGRYVPKEVPGEFPAPRGSHKYMAPELFDDSFGAIGPAIDIYALGFIMIELLVGPGFDAGFRGMAAQVTDSEKDWVRWHTARDEEPLSTSKLVAGVPSALATVLDRMVAKEQLQRYRNVSEVLEDLSELTQRVEPAQPHPAEALAKAPVAPHMPAPPRAAAAKPTAPPAPPFEIGPLPPWPDTPIVLRRASGNKAGEFLGFNTSRITIGNALDCQVSLVEETNPQLADTQIEITRETEGWIVRKHGQGTVLVNHHVIAEEATIRSGDMLRLSPKGPDLQFLVQVQNQKTLKSILAQHAPKALRAALTRSEKQQQLSPLVVPAPVRRPQEGKTSPGTAGLTTPAAPEGPLAPVGPALGYDANPTSGAPSFARLKSYYQSNKKQVNWMIAIGVVLLMAVVVLLLPTG
jgi:serine/threonine protein kinase